jgi:RES domain
VAEVDADKLDGASPVCLACAGGDRHVEQKILADGAESICAVCRLSKRTIPLSSIADMIEAVFEKYVHYGERRPWEPSLSTPQEIIQYEILNCDSDELADAIVQLLARKEDYAVRREGATPMFDTEESYKMGVIPTTEFEEEWERFEEGVKHRGRFFLGEEREYLEGILRPLLRGDLHRGQPPFVTLGAEGSQIKAIYRGRVANNSAEQKRILENPSRELAPPPPTLRTAGRMNAAGVVAFYGATDVVTCVAELAVPFGGAAVVGRFDFLRPVRVLDLRLLSRSSLSVSPFDPSYGEQVEYTRFMRQLRNLLRRPVMPGAETLDYLPTQMVAEFLSHEGLDGVILVSSVTPEAGKEATDEALFDAAYWDRTVWDEHRAGEADIARTTGLNVVLFSHAAFVINDMGPPQRRIARVHPPVEREPPFDNWLFVELADGPPPEDREPVAYPTFDDSIEPTLQLAEDSVILAVPKSIEYNVVTFPPTFSEPKKESPRDF